MTELESGRMQYGDCPKCGDIFRLGSECPTCAQSGGPAAPMAEADDEGFFDDADFVDAQAERLPVAYGGWAARPPRPESIDFAVPKRFKVFQLPREARYREAVTPHDIDIPTPLIPAHPRLGPDKSVSHESDTDFDLPVPAGVVRGDEVTTHELPVPRIHDADTRLDVRIHPTPEQFRASEKETELEIRAPWANHDGFHESDTSLDLPRPGRQRRRENQDDMRETGVDFVVPQLDDPLPADQRETGADFAVPRFDEPLPSDQRETGVDFVVPQLDNSQPADQRETGADFAVPRLDKPLPADQRETGVDFAVPRVDTTPPARHRVDKPRRKSDRNKSAREFRSFSDELLEGP